MLDGIISCLLYQTGDALSTNVSVVELNYVCVHLLVSIVECVSNASQVCALTGRNWSCLACEIIENVTLSIAKARKCQLSVLILYLKPSGVRP